MLPVSAETIPQELGALTKLKTLNFGVNILTGTKRDLRMFFSACRASILTSQLAGFIFGCVLL